MTEEKKKLLVDLTYDASRIKFKTHAGIFNLLEHAWGIMCNAYGGDWTLAPKYWKESVENWRDKYHNLLLENHVYGNTDEKIDEEITEEKIERFSEWLNKYYQPNQANLWPSQPLAFWSHSEEAKTIDNLGIRFNEETFQLEAFEEEE